MLGFFQEICLAQGGGGGGGDLLIKNIMWDKSKYLEILEIIKFGDLRKIRL